MGNERRDSIFKSGLPEGLFTLNLIKALSILGAIGGTIALWILIYNLVGLGWFCVIVILGALPSASIGGLLIFALLYPLVLIEQRIRDR